MIRTIRTRIRGSGRLTSLGLEVTWISWMSTPRELFWHLPLRGFHLCFAQRSLIYLGSPSGDLIPNKEFRCVLCVCDLITAAIHPAFMHHTFMIRFEWIYIYIVSVLIRPDGDQDNWIVEALRMKNRLKM